jgi:hypothetical protein
MEAVSQVPEVSEVVRAVLKIGPWRLLPIVPLLIVMISFPFLPRAQGAPGKSEEGRVVALEINAENASRRLTNLEDWQKTTQRDREEFIAIREQVWLIGWLVKGVAGFLALQFGITAWEAIKRNMVAREKKTNP